MGSTRYDPGAWSTYSTTKGTATKSASAIYSSRLAESVDPKKIKLRESCDSTANPLSTAIAVALDVTGSMDPVLEAMAKQGLNTLMTAIYERKPVTDPHLMYMAIGDIECDHAPLQATQFEAGAELLAQSLESLYLEHGGGGNMYESYALAWLFAARKTSIDCFKKRSKKGYLFTIGDELPTPRLEKEYLESKCGIIVEADIDPKALLTEVSRQWEVFHLIVEEGTNYTDRVRPAWTKLLGQRAIPLSDHTKMAEVIVSTIQVVEGADAKAVAGSWDGSTAIVVGKAIKDLTSTKKDGELVTL